MGLLEQQEVRVGLRSSAREIRLAPALAVRHPRRARHLEHKFCLAGKVVLEGLILAPQQVELEGVPDLAVQAMQAAPAGVILARGVQQVEVAAVGLVDHKGPDAWALAQGLQQLAEVGVARAAMEPEPLVQRAAWAQARPAVLAVTIGLGLAAALAVRLQLLRRPERTGVVAAVVVQTLQGTAVMEAVGLGTGRVRTGPAVEVDLAGAGVQD